MNEISEKIPINQNETLKAQINETQYINEKNTPAFNDIRVRLFELFENFISPAKELTLEEELNNKFLSLDFGSEFEINADKIGVNDAIFFVNLLNQQNLISYSIEDNKIQLSLDNQKINATNSLLNMLQTSIDSKKPIRLDFDKDVTVILKMDNDGKIQAHFIPGTLEVEKYLKNNIQSLKQAFEEEEINYSYLGYSKHKDNSKKEKRGKNQ